MESMNVNINMENLTEEQQKEMLELQKRMAELAEISQKPKSLRKRVERGKDYFYVSGDCRACCGTDWGSEYNWDSRVFNLGNYFLTQEEAKKAAKEIRRYWKLRTWAIEHNEGWEPDWSDTSTDKYIVYFSNRVNKYGICNPTFYENINGIYFKSKELAEQCIKELCEVDEDFKVV